MTHMQPKPIKRKTTPASIKHTGSSTVRRSTEQPASTLHIPGALLLPAVTAIVTGLSIPTLYRKVKAQEFPAPVKLGTRCTRWRSDDVRTWLAAR
jgi:prophage regulatory protein